MNFDDDFKKLEQEKQEKREKERENLKKIIDLETVNVAEVQECITKIVMPVFDEVVEAAQKNKKFANARTQRATVMIQGVTIGNYTTGAKLTFTRGQPIEQRGNRAGQSLVNSNNEEVGYVEVIKNHGNIVSVRSTATEAIQVEAEKLNAEVLGKIVSAVIKSL